jgi:hypothetical protein
MKNLLVKCIEKYIYIYIMLKFLNDLIVVKFYPWKSIS